MFRGRFCDLKLHPALFGEKHFNKFDRIVSSSTFHFSGTGQELVSNDIHNLLLWCLEWFSCIFRAFFFHDCTSDILTNLQIRFGAQIYLCKSRLFARYRRKRRLCNLAMGRSDPAHKSARDFCHFLWSLWLITPLKDDFCLRWIPFESQIGGTKTRFNLVLRLFYIVASRPQTWNGDLTCVSYAFLHGYVMEFARYCCYCCFIRMFLCLETSQKRWNILRTSKTAQN